MNSLPERKVWIDFLRVFAVFAVILTHVSAQNYYTTDVREPAWQIFNIYDSASRWAVPVFFMISGTIFLYREIPLKKLYRKYILRLAVAFVFWSVIYALFEEGSAADRIKAVFSGHYHMWFVLAIMGVYMCLPLIRAIVRSGFGAKYFLLLFLLFACVLPELLTLAEDFGNALIRELTQVFRTDLAGIDVHMVLGYSGCFVLGYYLDKTDLNRRQRLLLYGLGILGFLFTAVMSSIVALRTQKYCEHYYSSFHVNILLGSVAVFTLFRYGKFSNVRLNAFVRELAKCSFGAYLIHALVLEQMEQHLGLNTLAFVPAVSVICIAIIVWIVSYAVAARLNKVPFVNRYLV